MKNFYFIFCMSSLFYTISSIANEPEPNLTDIELKISQLPMSKEEPLFEQSLFEQKHKSPGLAVCLSALFPGLGHVYLGEASTAGELLGTAGLTLSTTIFTRNDLQITSFEALATTWCYSLYATYRDARIFNGTGQYSYEMPTDSFLKLATAPFNLRILKQPKVWGGLLGAFALAVGVGYLEKTAHSHTELSLSSVQSHYYPLFALPIGISEESLFRGYLQSQLSETFGPLGGILLSSIAFGAAHIPNGQEFPRKDRGNYYTFSIPFITAVGAYLGWLTYNTHSLCSSVALHTWYDFILFAIQASRKQASIKKLSEFVVAFPF